MTMRILRTVIFGIVIGILGGCLVSIISVLGNRADDVRDAMAISDEVLRFHVRANSDSEEDQELKMKVKETVLNELKPLLKEASSPEETIEIIEENMELIKQVSQDVIYENGMSYGVDAYFATEVFPMKQYLDYIFPSGEYDALRIDIGEAKGKNWWCVMFPPLCFVDATHAVVGAEQEETLQYMLTEEAYNEIHQDLAKIDEDKEVKIRVKFKIVEEVKKRWQKKS